MRRAFLYFAAGWVALGASAYLLGLRVIITDSASAPGIYRLAGLTLRRGVLVLACLPPDQARFARERGYVAGGTCVADAEPIAKIIGGLPGDSVDIEPACVMLNHVKLPNSQTLDRDSGGRPLPHVPFGIRQVRPGEVWLFGFHNPRSWDARYFAAIPLANVSGDLEKVLTW